MLIEYKKNFLDDLSRLSNKYSDEQIITIKKVMMLIENKSLQINSFKNHILGKYSNNKYNIYDCHPLYYDDSKIDLVLLYGYDKRQKRVLFISIGTHKEVFG